MHDVRYFSLPSYAGVNFANVCPLNLQLNHLISLKIAARDGNDHQSWFGYQRRRGQDTAWSVSLASDASSCFFNTPLLFSSNSLYKRRYIWRIYTYTNPRSAPSPPSSPTDSDQEDPPHEDENAAFEIPLNTLIECLNIFGTAGPLSNPNGANNHPGGGKPRKWRRADDDGSEEERERGRDDRRGALDNYFSSGGKEEKRTGMRMSFAGAGYPLTLLMYVLTSPCSHSENTDLDHFVLFHYGIYIERKNSTGHDMTWHAKSRHVDPQSQTSSYHLMLNPRKLSIHPW